MVRVSLILLMTLAQFSCSERKADNPFFEKAIVLKKEPSAGTYAIPKLVATPADSLLVVFQDRQGGDWGSPISPLCIRSVDKGETWSAPYPLVPDSFVPPDTFHVKPTGIVVDRHTGKIHVFISRSPLRDREGKEILERWFYSHIQETRDLGRAWFQVTSSDDGQTWSEPREITDQLTVKSSWQEWSPVHTGIQVQAGSHSGRLVVPVRCYCPETDPSIHDLKYQFNGVIYSDDGGEAWVPGGRSESEVGECSIVERSDGAVYVNHRTSASKARNPERLQNVSLDGGETFTALEPSGLKDARCHAGLTALPLSSGNRLLLMSSVPGPGRKGLTLNASEDEGRSWKLLRVIEPGQAAYSDLAVLSNGQIICVYETGEKTSRRHLAIARFNLAWIEENEF